MTKILKRYCLCAIFIVALVLIIYYNIFGRTQSYELINYQDEFVAVAYVDEFEEQHHDVPEHLVNLTDFHYLLQPEMCNQRRNEQFLGETRDD